MQPTNPDYLSFMYLPLKCDMKVVELHLHKKRYSLDIIRTNIKYIDIRVNLLKMCNSLESQSRLLLTKAPKKSQKLRRKEFSLVDNIKYDYIQLHVVHASTSLLNL